VLSTQQERSLKWIDPSNDNEERNGGQAGRVYGCQLKVPGCIQSGLTNDWEQ